MHPSRASSRKRRQHPRRKQLLPLLPPLHLPNPQHGHPPANPSPRPPSSPPSNQPSPRALPNSPHPVPKSARIGHSKWWRASLGPMAARRAIDIISPPRVKSFGAWPRLSASWKAERSLRRGVGPSLPPRPRPQMARQMANRQRAPPAANPPPNQLPNQQQEKRPRQKRGQPPPRRNPSSPINQSTPMAPPFPKYSWTRTMVKKSPFLAKSLGTMSRKRRIAYDMRMAMRRI
mmetsp:Transcript_12900/g.28024  ORF Transcript_12900/g.28024 Transcript_12900/m.28024 type:complete len:232 (+) Transcript_12900:251-946(+)